MITESWEPSMSHDGHLVLDIVGGLDSLTLTGNAVSGLVRTDR